MFVFHDKIYDLIILFLRFLVILRTNHFRQLMVDFLENKRKHPRYTKTIKVKNKELQLKNDLERKKNEKCKKKGRDGMCNVKRD